MQRRGEGEGLVENCKDPHCLLEFLIKKNWMVVKKKGGKKKKKNSVANDSKK